MRFSIAFLQYSSVRHSIAVRAVTHHVVLESIVDGEGEGR